MRQPIRDAAASDHAGRGAAAQQQLGELVAPAVALAGLLAHLEREPVGARRGEFVDVGADRVGQVDERSGVHRLHLRHGLAGRAQHQPRRHPQRREQGLGPPVLPRLGRTERHEHLPDRGRQRRLVRADEIEEAVERDRDGAYGRPV